MTSDSTKSSNSQPATDTPVYLFDDWFDPIEAGVRDRVRGFIEAMIEGELDSALFAPALRSKTEAGERGCRWFCRARPVTAMATGRGR